MKASNLLPEVRNLLIKLMRLTDIQKTNRFGSASWAAASKELNGVVFPRLKELKAPQPSQVIWSK